MTLTFKRTIATILAILTLISVISAFAVNAATSDKTATGAVIKEGQWFYTDEGEYLKYDGGEPHYSADGEWEYWMYSDAYSSGWGVSYIGSKTTITLPETIDGHIMNRPFTSNTTAQNITVPKNYISFGTHCFGSTSLKKVTFSRDYNEGDIKNFQAGVFQNATKLTTVVMPNLLPYKNVYNRVAGWYEGTQLPADTFNNCKKLTSVTLPNNLTDIDLGAFENCTSLTSLVIPEGVKYVDNAFGNCTAIEKVTFPSTIEKISFEANVPNCELVVPESKKSVVETALKNATVANKATITTIPDPTVDFNIPVQDIIDALSVDINNASYLSIYEGETKIVTDFTNDDLASLTVALQNNTVYTLRTYTDSDYTDYQFKVTSNGAITPYEAPEETTQATTSAATQPTTKPVVPATTPTTPATTEPSESSNSNNADDIDVEDNIILDAQTAKSQTVNKSYKAGKVVNIKINNACNVKPKFKSSKKSVASVNSKGKITCRTKGSATITVTLGTTKVKYKIKVTNNPSIKINGKKFKASTRYAIAKNKTIKIKINGKAKTVKNTYKSTKATVAKVTSNKTVKTVKIKGCKKGNATVTVKVNGYKSFKIKVKVK